MLDILYEGFGWITLEYCDGTKKIIKTTLNEKILNENNVAVYADGLYDFNKNEYIELDENAVLSVTKDKPELDEVNEFANRFI